MNQAHACELEHHCGISSDNSEQCCVALISSQDLVAGGIHQGLKKHDSIFIQDSFNDLSELENSSSPACYEVVLINARVIQHPLSEFFNKIKNKTPRARIIVFASEADHQFQRSLMRAGIYGFVTLDASIDMLCKAILSVKSAQLWFNKALLDEVVIDAMEFEKMIESSIKERIHVIKEQMTKRESEVFCLVLEGLSTKEIATQIHMSEPTVKQHLTSLFKKFDVNNRSQLILTAFERVCPVSNMIKLFRRTLDSHRINNGETPLIADPLQ